MPEANGLYYELHGPESAPPLILSSGLGGSASYWAPNIGALAEDFRVLVYDHRGTGRSDRTLSDEVTIGTMAEDLLSLMAALQIEPRNACVVGHAIGGLIGLEIALLHGLSKLVIVNGWAKIDPHTERCFEARLSLLRDSGPDAFVRAQPIFLFPANWIAAHEKLLTQQMDEQLEHFPGVSNTEKRIAAARNFELWLDMPDADVLVLVAEDDILVPSDRSKSLVAELCGLPKLAVMPWGGHACNVTDPTTFHSHVLRFLKKRRMFEFLRS